jgi:predicted nucleotidyltransferase
MAVYRATLWRREAELQEQLRQRTERAWVAARAAAAMLRERYGATRVVLYGSLARGHFTLWSDVDIAAWGISEDDCYAAVFDVLGVTEEIEVNLALIQHVRPEVLASIERDAEELP